MLDRLREDVDRVGIRHALLDLVEGGIKDPISGGLFALPHEAVDELAGQLGLVDRIGLQVGFTRGAFPGHEKSYLFGHNKFD
jgi:hypothetical protein